MKLHVVSQGDDCALLVVLMDDWVRVHMIISGVVQGVFFRAHTRERARSLNLQGWVRNLVDGSVEVVAEGPHDALSRFIEWCHRGPPGARVDGVEVDWESVTGELRGFDIRY